MLMQSMGQDFTDSVFTQHFGCKTKNPIIKITGTSSKQIRDGSPRQNIKSKRRVCVELEPFKGFH